MVIFSVKSFGPQQTPVQTIRCLGAPQAGTLNGEGATFIYVMIGFSRVADLSRASRAI
jgi:hypothetical protein